MKQRLLITGSAGFLGANLIRFLLFNKKEYEISGIDKLKDTAYIHNVYMNKSTDFYIADVCDKDIIDKIFGLTKPNIIIYLASKDHDNILYNNIIGFKNVLDLSIKHKADKIIYISTTHLYDASQDIVNEDSFLLPTNEYLISKQCCENLLITNKSINYNIIRAPDIFGPRQLHGKVVEMFLDVKGNDNILLNNKGMNENDILHVEDFSNAVSMIIENGKQNEIYNATMNCDYTELEIASIVIEILKEGKIIFNNENIDLTYKSKKIDTSKIKSLGWKPLKKFKDRIKDTVWWFANNTWIFK